MPQASSLKPRFLHPTPRGSDSVGRGWGGGVRLRIGVSNTVPGAANAVLLGPLIEPLLVLILGCGFTGVSFHFIN